MLLQDKKTFKYDITALNETEAKIMISFLKSESDRHKMDIDDIALAINYLKTKFNLNIFRHFKLDATGTRIL